uniref:Uncharacterized protein n=1 Tax=Bactrocera latifrons TaxID=174628 RepID=A0A0K8VHM4_BACLA
MWRLQAALQCRIQNGHILRMCFLQDIMKSRSMSGNLINETSCDELVELHDEDKSETPESIKLMQPTHKKLKKKLTESSAFLELEEKKRKLLEKSNDEEDGDYLFLMSFKKYIKNMGEEKK